MTTSKSPRKVLKIAHELACKHLKGYGSKFSRHDFTQAQLFACLVLREHQKKSYRGLEELLEDSPLWREDIGLPRTPDHNTLCRAFAKLVKPGLIKRMLDQTVVWARKRGMLRHTRIKPVALDSSMFESHHVSRHFEKRCRQTAALKKVKNNGKSRPMHNAGRSSGACQNSPWPLPATAT
jgi:hypothetical protein